jgi:hypothetical protein
MKNYSFTTFRNQKKLFFSTFRRGILHPLFKRKSFGQENPDKKFAVLNITGRAGLFAMINLVLINIRYCLERNIILVVDMQNGDNQFHDILKKGKENAWELFLEQPFGFDLNQIQSSKNIFEINKKRMGNPFSCLSKYTYFSIYNFDRDFTLFQEYKNDFKQHIKFNETVKTYINAEYEKIFENKGRVLGVLARGTDYLLKKPGGHRVQPEPDLIMEKTEKVMTEQKLDYIYLATEDDFIFQLFREKFGKKLLINNQKRTDPRQSNEKDLWITDIDFGTTKYELQLTYFSSIYNLSKCQCFVGGVTSGTTGVFLMKEDDFEYKYLFDLGNY